MNQTAKELLSLLQDVRRHSKKDALSIMRGLTPEGQHSLLLELRRHALESRGQGVLPIGQAAPRKASLPAVKAKKVPYTVLLPPSMIEGLKDLSDADGAPVSHHIRLAIKAYLERRR